MEINKFLVCACIQEGSPYLPCGLITCFDELWGSEGKAQEGIGLIFNFILLFFLGISNYTRMDEHPSKACFGWFGDYHV